MQFWLLHYLTPLARHAPIASHLQIAWDSNRASPAEIAETLAAVDETVGLQEVRKAVLQHELLCYAAYARRVVQGQVVGGLPA